MSKPGACVTCPPKRRFTPRTCAACWVPKAGGTAGGARDRRRASRCDTSTASPYTHERRSTGTGSYRTVDTWHVGKPLAARLRALGQRESAPNSGLSRPTGAPGNMHPARCSGQVDKVTARHAACRRRGRRRRAPPQMLQCAAARERARKRASKGARHRRPLRAARSGRWPRSLALALGLLPHVLVALELGAREPRRVDRAAEALRVPALQVLEDAA